MSAVGHKKILTVAALATCMTIPTTVGFLSEATWAAAPVAEATLPAISADEARAILNADIDNADLDRAAVPTQSPDAVAPKAEDRAEIDAELECMAKVVHHEAANQSRRGQLAVAQLIVNRIESGKFPTTICGVTNQPGQFFNTSRYNPRRDTAQWAMAVEVSREARLGHTADVVPGAVFYHASYQSPPRFFRTRERVTTLGDHIFYR